MKLIVLLGMIMLIGTANLHAGDSTSTSLKEGDDAPTFYLKDLQGNDIFLRDFCGAELRQPWKNKTKYVIVLSFFATWCVPCQKEIPCLEELLQKYADQPIKFFLVDVGEKKPLVQPFIQKKGYRIPVLMDIYKMVSMKKYGVEALPRLVVIDKEGKIALIKRGFKDRNTLFSKLIPVIDNALKDGN